MRVWTFAGLIALVLGFGFFEGLEALELPFLALGSVVLVGVMIGSVRQSRDYLNPLLVLVASAFVRLGLPAVLSLWYEPPTNLVWFNLPSVYWQQGRALALMAVLAVTVGWLLVPRGAFASSERAFQRIGAIVRIDQRSAILASICVVVGVLFALIYLRLNFSSAFDAVAEGSIRKNPSYVSGTSRYSFLAYWLLNSGAAILSCYLISVRNKPWWIGLAPGFVVLLVLSPFGQRVGAMTALIYGLLLLWYRGNVAAVRLYKVGLVLLIVLPLLMIYIGFILYYRGAGIASGLELFSTNGLRDYIEYTVWVELGTLHPFVMATVFPPGVLHGQTYPLIGLYVSDLFGIDGVRPGAFMVEQLISPAGGWGYHTGLVIDVYMNTGLLASVVAGIVFGAVLRLIYVAFMAQRRSAGAALCYVVFSWNLFWIFYESIINIFPLATTCFFLVMILFISRVLPRSQPGVAPRSALPSLRQ